MLNKIISISSGFMMGSSIVSVVMTSNPMWFVPIIAGFIIIIANFTGFGE